MHSPFAAPKVKDAYMARFRCDSNVSRPSSRHINWLKEVCCISPPIKSGSQLAAFTSVNRCGRGKPPLAESHPFFFLSSNHSTDNEVAIHNHNTSIQVFLPFQYRRETCRRQSLSCKPPTGGMRVLLACPPVPAQPIEFSIDFRRYSRL